MDWQRNVLVMQNYLLKPPLKTPAGLDLRQAYDPDVTRYKGELWVAFECTAPSAVSTCVAPISSDLKRIDLDRLTIPAAGILGPHGPNGQIVCIISASAPTLLTYRDQMFLYWQADYFDNQLPENALVTRGMQLQEDSRGQAWGVGSDGKSVLTNDPRLTSLVQDVNRSDKLEDHVALTSDLVVIGNQIMDISSTGGSAGQQICRSTHDISPDCFRVTLSIADEPLGSNIFGQHRLTGPSLPANGVEYPRVIVDPQGQQFLLGYYFQPKATPQTPGRTMYGKNGLEYIPFEPANFVRPF